MFCPIFPHRLYFNIYYTLIADSLVFYFFVKISLQFFHLAKFLPLSNLALISVNKNDGQLMCLYCHLFLDVILCVVDV